MAEPEEGLDDDMMLDLVTTNTPDEQRLRGLLFTQHPRTPNELVLAAHQNSREHGFWDGAPTFGDAAYPEHLLAKLMLIVSEVAEAQEIVRDPAHMTDLRRVWFREKDGKPEGFPIELADVIIRIADLCGRLGIDLDAAIEAKHVFNVSRPHMHGKTV